MSAETSPDWRTTVRRRALVVLALFGVWAVAIEARLVYLQVLRAGRSAGARRGPADAHRDGDAAARPDHRPRGARARPQRGRGLDLRRPEQSRRRGDRGPAHLRRARRLHDEGPADARRIARSPEVPIRLGAAPAEEGTGRSRAGPRAGGRLHDRGEPPPLPAPRTGRAPAGLCRQGRERSRRARANLRKADRRPVRGGPAGGRREASCLRARRPAAAGR